MIFMNSEINDIDLKDLFFRIFKIPAARSKNLEFQVKMCFLHKFYLKAEQFLQRPQF